MHADLRERSPTTQRMVPHDPSLSDDPAPDRPAPPGDASDDELIDSTLAGRSAAYGDLVRRYQDRLFNAVMHIIGNRVEAEDVVQDAFVQAFVKLDSFKRDSGFYTWIYRIAFNGAISRRRRHRIETSIEHTREATGDEPLDHRGSPSDPLEIREQGLLINQALQMLSDEHLEIIVLREMNGRRYDELAEILGIEVGTVRSRLHRGRAHLRELLKQIMPDDVPEDA
jgi:RNA polymerase sigma-70 factor (ECF subfamily)